MTTTKVRNHWFRIGGKGTAHVQSTAFGYTGCGLPAFGDATADRNDRSFDAVPIEWTTCGRCRRIPGALTALLEPRS
jgi:hypothetical protein